MIYAVALFLLLQAFVAGEVTGDGYLMPFRVCGLAEVWPLRCAAETSLVVVPQANESPINAALDEVEVCSKKEGGVPVSYAKPRVVGVTTIMEAFLAAFEKHHLGPFSLFSKCMLDIDDDVID